VKQRRRTRSFAPPFFIPLHDPSSRVLRNCETDRIELSRNMRQFTVGHCRPRYSARVIEAVYVEER
jgi:hypothetical protein